MKEARIIEGKDVYLRPLDEGDASGMTNWVNDQEITQYLNIEPPVSEEWEREWVVSVNKSETDLVFAIVEKESDEHIGNVGFHQINRGAENANIGIFIGELSRQGKGYGTEALRLAVVYACSTLHVKVIRAMIFASNARSISLFEKAGFEKRCVVEKSYLKNKKWIDEVVYEYVCSG